MSSGGGGIRFVGAGGVWAGRRGHDFGGGDGCGGAADTGGVRDGGWGGAPGEVTVSEGQKAAGAIVKVAAAAMVRVLVRDEGKLLEQKDAAGRRPELSVGVWGPQGLYYPAAEGGRSGTAAGRQGEAVYWLGRRAR